MQEVRAQCGRLEQELRKSKRREEKLTALQYRLKEDVRQMGTDARSVYPTSDTDNKSIHACVAFLGTCCLITSCQQTTAWLLLQTQQSVPQ